MSTTNKQSEVRDMYKQMTRYMHKESPERMNELLNSDRSWNQTNTDEASKSELR